MGFPICDLSAVGGTAEGAGFDVSLVPHVQGWDGSGSRQVTVALSRSEVSSLHRACGEGKAVLKVAARPVPWQNTKRTLEEGTNGLGTRDVYDYRRPGGCLEDVLTGAGSGWADVSMSLLRIERATSDGKQMEHTRLA